MPRGSRRVVPVEPQLTTCFLLLVDDCLSQRHPRRVIAFLRVLWGAMSDFRRHGCGSLAASLAYFALLSFFPLVFLILYLVGFIVSQRIDDQFLLSALQGFFPTIGPGMAAEVKRVASEEVVRWVVFLTFVWFSLLVFYEVDYTINVVFETIQTRHALISTIISTILLTLVGVLLLASYAVTQLLNVLVAYAPRLWGIDMLTVAAHGFLIAYVFPFVVVFVAVTILYRYLPRTRPAWEEAATGGLVLALLWELGKHFFRGYVQEVTIYGRMYGSFLAVILFLVWVYYTAALFLYGAAIVHRLQTRRRPACSP